MKHDHRLAQFSKLLQDFILRAEVNDTELARRIGSTRLSVRRWREGVSLRHEETIHRLKAGLWWQDHMGSRHELTAEELSQLRIAASYYDIASEPDTDRSPNGTAIASGSDDNTVQVWEATTGRLLHIYKGHTNGVYALAWSPDGKRIASGSWDKTVQVWRAR